MPAMLVNKLIAIQALTLSLVLTYPTISWSQDKTDNAKVFADSVLAMFDQGRYGEMYDAFDPNSRTLTREQWIQTCETIAKQRGKVVNRALANKTHSMGIYRFLYSSQCANGKVFEDVGVSDNSGSWKIVGFIIRPNLE